jgi:hypothetical protein
VPSGEVASLPCRSATPLFNIAHSLENVEGKFGHWG